MNLYKQNVPKLNITELGTCNVIDGNTNLYIREILTYVYTNM